MNMIRKGQVQGIEKGDILGQVEFVYQIFELLHKRELIDGKAQQSFLQHNHT